MIELITSQEYLHTEVTPSLHLKYSKNGGNLPGADCSKSTKSLVNVSLNFQRKYFKCANIFCWKKMRIFCIAKDDSHNFPTKKTTTVFDNVVGI